MVWALTGLWHGASWNFLLWGLYFALLLMIEKLFLLRWLDRAPLWLGHLYTLFFLLMGWALFFFTSLPELWAFLGRLFGGGAVSPEGRVAILGYLPLLLVAAVASTPFGSRVYGRIRDTVWGRYGAVGLGMAALVLLSLIHISPGLRQPFLLENAPLVKQGIPFAKRGDVALFIHQLDGVQLGLELSPYGGKIYAVKLLLLFGFLGRQRAELL